VPGRPITEAEFGRLLKSFSRSAWRLETYDSYHLGYEAADFEQFLAGRPVPPPEVSWWRPWLDMISTMTQEGKRIGRVRILAEPPTDYQRWELWAAHWHAQAGEQTSYLSRSQAAALGLRTKHDWWLLDEQTVIVMRFDDGGKIVGKELITDPGIVAQHREWRDLAVCHAIPAEEFTAA
jgi:hypothetical protein